MIIKQAVDFSYAHLPAIHIDADISRNWIIFCKHLTKFMCSNTETIPESHVGIIRITQTNTRHFYYVSVYWHSMCVSI